MPAIFTNSRFTAASSVQTTFAGREGATERICASCLLSRARNRGHGLGVFQRCRCAELALGDRNVQNIAEELVFAVVRVHRDVSDSSKVVFDGSTCDLASA